MECRKKTKTTYHIARRVGYQGARHSVSNQADDDKCTTGRRTNVNLRKSVKIGTWNVRKMKEPGKLNVICNEMDRYNLQILAISET